MKGNQSFTRPSMKSFKINPIFILFAFLSLMLHNQANAVLLDKMVSVFNDKIITQSMVTRLKNTYEARKYLAPQIYNLENKDTKSIIEHFIKRLIIREKLKSLGIEIKDNFVKSNIQRIMSNLNLNHDQLLSFLDSKNITYPEYFEVMREGMEFQEFYIKFINPLITISDQEIKNLFFKKNSNDKTISYKYNIIDYNIPGESINSVSQENLLKAVKKLQKNIPLSKNFSKLEKNVLGDLNEDDLSNKIKILLKPLGEGEFSKPFLSNGLIHIFYVKSKNLTESGAFKREKNIIRAEISAIKAKKVLKSWFIREKSKFFIKYFYNGPS